MQKEEIHGYYYIIYIVSNLLLYGWKKINAHINNV